MQRVTWTGSPEVLIVSESSLDYTETNFRELDDAFLQIQTRTWLGEVLHLRFDEDVGIADLLADGELLFQLSKQVWKMLLRKHGELKHSKVHIYERTSSGKSDGRYMPYPKVDSFLKICQILDLTGIDLFSPSDVVEKRDIRRVCMCVRSLSKKARAKKLNVPDFDIAAYTIAMPTCFVGGIRKVLELSWRVPSSYSMSSTSKDARKIYQLKLSFEQQSQYSDPRSDKSESHFSDLEFQSPFLSASYDSYVVEIFAESAYSRHLSTMETCTLQNLSSSSYSGRPIDEDSSICFSDIDKGSADSIPKVVKNRLKVENLAITLYFEASYQTFMNASSLIFALSEDNQHSQSSYPPFSHLEIHSNVEVVPCNTRRKSCVFENSIASNNKDMKKKFYYMETSHDSNSVTPMSCSSDTEAYGNDGNSPSKIKSPSILDLNSLDNYCCGSKLDGSESTMVSRDSYLFFSSFVDKQNNFPVSLVGLSPERNQNEQAYTSLSSVENDCALLSQPDDPKFPAKSNCGSQSTKFECSSSSMICSFDTEADGNNGNSVEQQNSMVDGSSNFPEKEDSVEHADGLFYYGISFVDDSNSSDELKMHQSSHDALDISFALSVSESLIPTSKKDRDMNVAGEESSVNPESCQYDDGKMKDLEVLDVMESSDSASNGYASEMIPSFEFCCSDLFQSHRNILETEGETFQIVDVLPSSTSVCRERKEVISDETIEVEKYIVSDIRDDCAEPNNLPQAILKDSNNVGKTGNQALKSVAGVMAMVGAFLLFLQARQKKDREKNNEMWMPFQIQKSNQEFFTKRRIKIGKSDSLLYPGEKLNF